MWIVDIAVRIAVLGAKFMALWDKKMKLWVDGREGIFERLAAAIQPTDKVIWFHAASLGEFEEGRPVIEAVRERYPQYKILLTFFSPSGYEIRKNYAHADWVFYLPADTKSNMKRFMDVVHPEIAIFIKYEFWLNMLAEMRKRPIRTFVISARFIPNSRFFSWWGGIFRNSLRSFETIFTQDQQSIDLLQSIGINTGVLAGDPRFDRVAAIAETPWENEIMKRFKNGEKVFVAGSTCGGTDEALMQNLINRHRDLKFMLVPHEMDVAPMEKFESNTIGRAIRFSSCTPETDFSNYQVLIVDTIGMLASLYRYGNWAFIGGGFIAGIHSVIEATVYGLPAVFGPNYAKNRPAIDMIAIGACGSIGTADELDAWLTDLRVEAKLEQVSQLAYNYTKANCGATNTIINRIFDNE